MRVTSKGQVTIPKHIRTKLRITPFTEINFVEEGDRVYLVKVTPDHAGASPLRKVRGIAQTKMTTDEILRLTRTDA